MRIQRTKPHLTASRDDCDKCERGWIERVNESGSLRAARCDCYSSAIAAGRLNAARIPFSYFGAMSLDLSAPSGSDGWREASAALARSTAEGDGLLTLIGPPGSGKSWLMANQLRRAAETRSVAWLSTRSIHQTLKAFGGLDVAIEHLLSVEVLAIDEIGYTRAGRNGETSFAMDVITQLLCDRLERGWLTWCTSNSAPDELAGDVGPAVYDRLRGGGVFVISGQSMRGLA